MQPHNEIYKLTNRERWTALAELHAKWGNEELAQEYQEMAESSSNE